MLLPALSIATLVFLMWKATSRERLFLLSVVGYLFLTTGLITGCITASQRRVDVATEHRVGLPAEEVKVPRLQVRRAEPEPLPPSRAERRRAERIERREARRDNRARRRAQVAAAQPARVKVKNSGNVTHQVKDKSHTVDKSKEKPTVKDKPRPAPVPAAEPKRSWLFTALSYVPLGGWVALGVVVVVCWFWRLNPLRWVKTLFGFLARNRRDRE